jgi:hypothetical protein
MKDGLVEMVREDPCRTIEIRDRAGHACRAMDAAEGQAELATTLVEQPGQAQVEAVAIVKVLRRQLGIRPSLACNLRLPRVSHAAGDRRRPLT